MQVLLPPHLPALLFLCYNPSVALWWSVGISQQNIMTLITFPRSLGACGGNQVKLVTEKMKVQKSLTCTITYTFTSFPLSHFFICNRHLLRRRKGEEWMNSVTEWRKAEIIRKVLRHGCCGKQSWYNHIHPGVGTRSSALRPATRNLFMAFVILRLEKNNIPIM